MLVYVWKVPGAYPNIQCAEKIQRDKGLLLKQCLSAALYYPE